MRKTWITALVLAVASTVGAQGLMAQEYRRDNDRSRNTGTDTWSEWWSSWWQDNEDDDSGRSSRSGTQAFIRQHDRDDDGYLTQRELPNDMRTNFNRYDANEDNYLSSRELERHAVQRRAERRSNDQDYRRYSQDDRANERRDDRDYWDMARGSDQRSQSDETDSWSEWWSSWWTDEQNTRGDESQSFDAGVRAFVRRHDDNDDQRLSRGELPEDMRRGFARFDADDNGYLSSAELRKHARKMTVAVQPVEVTYIWVVDSPDKVNHESLQEAYGLLQRIDSDNNGEISREELREQRQQVLSRWIDKVFQKRDSDGDREITQQEARGTLLEARFSRLDRDDDGALTRSELRRAGEQPSQTRSAERRSRDDDDDRYRDGERRR